MTSGTGPPQGNNGEPDSGPRPFAWHGVGEALVADDEPSVRLVTVRALQRLGLTVTGVEDGEAAVTTFRSDVTRWRLVLLDLTMPRLGGIEALVAIRALRADVPVVLSSGYAEDELGSRVPDRDRLAFLQKPFTVRTLSEAVRQVLGPPDGA